MNPCMARYNTPVFLLRSGRFGKKGLALNMIDGHGSMQIMKAIEGHFSRPIAKLDADDIDELEKLNDG